MKQIQVQEQNKGKGQFKKQIQSPYLAGESFAKYTARGNGVKQ